MNSGFRLAIALSFVSFVFGTSLIQGQESFSSTTETSLPNSPSASQPTTCTQNNGKPCPEWVHKMVGQYPPSSGSGEVQLRRDPSSVHFWTYRGWQDPPLRSNREVFHSKLILGAHIGGAIAMIVACRTKNSGEHWNTEAPGVAALLGLDYLQFRFVGGPNAIGPPIYEMIHYGLASAR